MLKTRQQAFVIGTINKRSGNIDFDLYDLHEDMETAKEYLRDADPGSIIVELGPIKAYQVETTIIPIDSTVPDKDSIEMEDGGIKKPKKKGRR